MLIGASPERTTNGSNKAIAVRKSWDTAYDFSKGVRGKYAARLGQGVSHRRNRSRRAPRRDLIGEKGENETDAEAEMMLVKYDLARATSYLVLVYQPTAVTNRIPALSSFRRDANICPSSIAAVL